MVIITEANFPTIVAQIKKGMKFVVTFNGPSLPRDITPNRAYPVLSALNHEDEQKFEFLDDAGDSVATCVHNLVKTQAAVTLADGGNLTDSVVGAWQDAINLEKYALLKNAFNTFQADNTFEPGQVIRWKPQMKDRRVPEYGTPVIVTEILDEVLGEPLEGCNEDGITFGSPYATTRYDIIVGHL